MPETDTFYELCDQLGIMVWQDRFVTNTSGTKNFPHKVLEAQIAYHLYRTRNHPSLVVLCTAFIHLILQYISAADHLSASVHHMISEIENNFYDHNINLRHLLQKSGYAEDYIRAHFKKVTGKTPNSFLTDIRIKHAAFFIDIYANTLSLQQIAEQCGYTDYVYFSKTLKSILGVSPKEYKSTISN